MLLRDLTTWALRWAAAMKRSLSHCSAHGLRKSGQRLLPRRLYCRGEWRARPASTESGGLKNAIGPFLKNERMQQEKYLERDPGPAESSRQGNSRAKATASSSPRAPVPQDCSTTLTTSLATWSPPRATPSPTRWARIVTGAARQLRSRLEANQQTPPLQIPVPNLLRRSPATHDQ
jgi:hypothetical protein